MTFLANVGKNGGSLSYKILENQEGGVWTILNYRKGIVSYIVRDEGTRFIYMFAINTREVIGT